MSVSTDKMAEVLALPPADRAFLARELIASLDGTIDEDAEAQWHGVIQRRSREIETGTVQCRPVENVVCELREKLHAHRHAS